MTRKPLVLVISHQENISKKNVFKTLNKDYTLNFFLFRKNIALGIQLEKLFLKLKNKPQAIISFTDNTSLFASVVIKKFELIGPNPTSLAKIQNKENFCRNLKDQTFLPKTHFVKLSNLSKKLAITDYPIFIKPTKGSLSEGALKINNNKDVKKIIKIALLTLNIHRFEQSFFKNYFKNFSLETMIIQAYIKQPQYTLDGFIQNGEISFLGIIESIYDKNHTSFIRFDFPSILRKATLDQLKKATQTIFDKFSFNNSFFNLEFFVLKNGDIKIIELNTRPSIVFEPFYNLKYKQRLIEMMIQLALGNKPQLDLKKEQLLGKSFILRKYKDYLVSKNPTQNEIKNITKQYKLSKIKILSRKNKYLSQQKQDSYSYRYAIIDICGRSDQEIFQKYKKIKKDLNKLFIFS